MSGGSTGGPPGRQPEVQPEHQTYAGQQQQNLQADAENQNAVDGNGGIFDAVGDVARVSKANIEAQQYAEQQAQQLRQGLETRGGPSMPDTYYLGHEHEAMKGMVDENLDPAQVNDAGVTWNKLGNALIDFQAAFSAAANRSTEDWSGAAGDGARGYVTKLGESMGSSGQGFQLAGNRMFTQSQAAEQARNAMPEPVQFTMDDALGMLERQSDPFALGDTVQQINQKFDEKQQAHEQAAQVMTTYSQSLSDAGTAMPAFAPPPAMAPPPGPGGDPGGPGSSDPGGSGQRTFGGGPGGGTGPASVGSLGSTTASQGFQPGPGIRPGPAPVGPGPNNDPARFQGQLPVGGFPPGGPGRPGGPGGPGGRPGPGGRGFGPGGGRGFGPTGGAPGGRPGFGPVGSGGAGQGAAGARPPGGIPGEGAAGRGAGGGAGRAGAGAGAGGMGGGAGKGQGGEDAEHQRPKYLVEADPEAIFGTDRMTAPPVIE